MATETMPVRSGWRYFPAWVAGSLLVVIAVNGVMIWSAVSSFPGAVNEDAFDTGNSYNQILAAAQKQAALGWRFDVEEKGGVVAITLAGRDGSALPHLSLRAVATRPVGPPERTALALRPEGTRFIADRPLGAGAWDIAVAGDSPAGRYRAIRRVAVP